MQNKKNFKNITNKLEKSDLLKFHYVNILLSLDDICLNRRFFRKLVILTALEQLVKSAEQASLLICIPDFPCLHITKIYT